MRVLILEDDPVRHDIFRMKLYAQGIDNITIVVTSIEAIEYLKSEKWDYLFLDHDLGGEQMVESGPNTGYEVAEWLSQNVEYLPEHVCIHTLNPIGRQRMKQALPLSNVQVIPFSMLFN